MTTLMSPRALVEYIFPLILRIEIFNSVFRFQALTSGQPQEIVEFMQSLHPDRSFRATSTRGAAARLGYGAR
jgi:hypothetical protein